ncbi:MAG TPA: dethiobiotin synthase, partial [Clostridia bacterium]|nr:dethiobiotin synthase [Clostridia bacterium]
MGKGLFVTATGTDVGKTFVTALIVKKLRDTGHCAGYYKAALSGATRTKDGFSPGDAEYVRQIAGLNKKAREMVSYVYENAYSPHLAAQIEGNPVDMSVIKSAYKRLASVYDYVTVEGSGGIMCPLR